MSLAISSRTVPPGPSGAPAVISRGRRRQARWRRPCGAALGSGGADEGAVGSEGWYVRTAAMDDLSTLADIRADCFGGGGFVARLLPGMTRNQMKAELMGNMMRSLKLSAEAEARGVECKYTVKVAVCVATQAVVGGVDLLLSQELVKDGAPNTAYVASMATRPDVRGRGIAKALLDDCHLVSRQWGRPALSLHVQSGPEGAVARGLYERFGGFEVIGQDPDIVKRTGGMHRLLMRRDVK